MCTQRAFVEQTFARGVIQSVARVGSSGWCQLAEVGRLTFPKKTSAIFLNILQVIHGGSTEKPSLAHELKSHQKRFSNVFCVRVSAGYKREKTCDTHTAIMDDLLVVSLSVGCLIRSVASRLSRKKRKKVSFINIALDRRLCAPHSWNSSPRASSKPRLRRRSTNRVCAKCRNQFLHRDAFEYWMEPIRMGKKRKSV